MSHFSTLVITEGAPCYEDLERMMLPYREADGRNLPDEYLTFVEDDEEEVDQDTGLRGYWYNEDARWDWWVVGGRWRGLLRASDGGWADDGPYEPGRFDQARLRDVDTSVDEAALATAGAAWDSGATRLPGGWLRGQLGSRETYEAVMSMLWTHAVVTPDGSWHEVGKMGWFGFSGETPDELAEWVGGYAERFVERYRDCLGTVLDCHV